MYTYIHTYVSARHSYFSFPDCCRHMTQSLGYKTTHRKLKPGRRHYTTYSHKSHTMTSAFTSGMGHRYRKSAKLVSALEFDSRRETTEMIGAVGARDSAGIIILLRFEVCARQMVPAGWRIKAENLRIRSRARGSAHGIAKKTHVRYPSRVYAI